MSNIQKILKISLVRVVIALAITLSPCATHVSGQSTGSMDPSPDLRRSIAAARFSPEELRVPRKGLTLFATRGHRPASPAKRVLLGAVGAFGGFWAGAFVGYKVERHWFNCGCDDPGLKGFIIGAPIGTIAGAILAVKLGS